MTAKRVIVDQIEITRIGHINVRFHKQIVDDDNITVLMSDNHRTVLEIGQDIDLQMDLVNKHLEKMGFPNVSKEEYQNIKKYADIKWTSELKKWWKEQKEKNVLEQSVKDKGFSHVVF